MLIKVSQLITIPQYAIYPFGICPVEPEQGE